MKNKLKNYDEEKLSFNALKCILADCEQQTEKETHKKREISF